MRFRLVVCGGALALASMVTAPAHAQVAGGGAASPSDPQAAGNQAPDKTTIACASTANERQHCDADTSAGVLLVRVTGNAPCLLGKSWGYDQAGVWVADGCAGEFAVGALPASAAPGQSPDQLPAAATPRKPTSRIESWGEFEPGDGFLVGRSSAGELAISAYTLVRWIDQTPASQTYADHLGTARTTDARNDVFPHRIMIFFKGWVGNPKFVYTVFLWTVNTTDQKSILAGLGYQFSRRFSLYAGINGLPGTRSVQGSHPYWLGHDRVMADEFFRPYFTNGIWAQGEITPGLWYNAMAGNNMSSLGVKATQLDRRWSNGESMWWMPTTHEFGPKGAFGDWERHDKLATRFGFSTTYSPEERYTDGPTGATGNTTIRLADGINVFDTGALAPKVTVQTVDYRILSFDAGMKYRGFFLQTEIYDRWLDHFVADAPLPVSSIHDAGFYLQGAFYPIPKKLELYAATSQIYGDKSAGFEDSREYLAGANFYPFNTRNHRLNFQVINVDRSPVNSTFGYYTGGQSGTTLAAAVSVFF